MKQETLEKVAERLYPINFIIDYDTNKEERDIWLNGAIWQKQRSYSKEEVLELIQFLAEKEDFKKHSSMSIFIAEDYLNEFKNK